MCLRGSWWPNMPTSWPPLSSVTRPAWSTPCSTSSRGVCVQTNSAAPPGDTMAPHDDISAEDRLIARFFKPLATHPGALGLSDDAAFLTPPAGYDLVLTTDAIVGGVHFFPEDAAHTVAGRALRGILGEKMHPADDS